MKYDRKNQKGRERAAPADPMETFEMVNRHTEEVARKAAARKRKAASGRNAKAARRTAQKRVDREAVIRANVKRHRVRHKKNYILYYLLLLFILAAVGITLSLTVFFKIGHFEVEGNGSISAASLIEATGVKLEDNLFRISTDRAEKSIISQFVTIDNADVSRRLPDTLSIRVEPSQLLAVVRYGELYFNVSKGSRIIGVSEEAPGETGVPIIVGCDYADVELGDYLDRMDVEKNKLESMQTVLDAIEENSLKNVGYIDLEDIAFVKLYYEDRLEIKMGGLTDFSYELGRVKQLIQTKVPENESGVLDATLHNGTYYYRDTGTISLPGGEQRQSRPQSDGVAGYDLPGDELRLDGE